MKVFISWSGPHSRQVAMALREWLPQVLQSIDPFVSSEDIDKGSRWGTDIATQLSDTNFGIVCLTPTNIASPWINFEAGALSKTPSIARVVPFLHGLKKTDVPPPLGLFQATSTDKEDILLLLRTLNDSAETALPEGRLLGAFDVWWPRLEESLAAVTVTRPASPGSQAPTTGRRSDTAMLEEVLSLVRGLTRATSPNVRAAPEVRAWLRDLEPGEDPVHKDVTRALMAYGLQWNDYSRNGTRVGIRINADYSDTVEPRELLSDLDKVSTRNNINLAVTQPDGNTLIFPRRPERLKTVKDPM